MMEKREQQLGNYRLLKLLGHGGFADVYLGEHIYLKTQAAIKVLHTHISGQENEEFRHEAHIIAHLVHPNIIRVLDFGIEQETPFLVMEYAPNGTLAQRIPSGTRVAPVVMLPYIKQIAAALQYAHDQRLIHRDIKPANMLLSANDEVKLSDFGIALAAKNSASLETGSSVMGTMAYIAPEQLAGKPRTASDQYALAVVVYEWLTGEKPFKGSYMEVLSQHLSAPPPTIDEQTLAIPHAVTQVIWRAMAKDPHTRFPRVQDFADALEQAFRTGRPIAVGAGAARPASEEYVNRGHITRPLPTSQARAKTIATTAGKHAVPVITGAIGCARTLIASIVVLALVLCGLGFAGYNYLVNRNPPTQGTALARNFMQGLINRNYDQAYSDLGSNITSSTSHDSFIQQAQKEDSCAGPVTGYQQSSASTPNGTQNYDYNVSRAKLSQPYHLHVTVAKDFWGNWHITDYNSDVTTCS